MDTRKDQEDHQVETLPGWACASIGVGFVVAVVFLLAGAVWLAN